MLVHMGLRNMLFWDPKRSMLQGLEHRKRGKAAFADRQG